MPLREVKPFNAEQWKLLQENMKRGPTEKQIKQREDAKERMKNRKVNF